MAEKETKLVKIPAKIGRALRTVIRALRNTIKSRRLELFPLFRILKNYDMASVRADAKAGLNVAMLAFPQGIAYALIAGLPPQHGLISAAFGGMVSAAFSGTRLVAIGPGNSTAILIFSGLMASGFTTDAERVMVLPLFVFMVGCFQLIGALANMSLVINYVSRSVVTAYISAAGALIIVNQLQNLLGFTVANQGATLLSSLAGTIQSLPQTRLPELTLGVMSVLTIILLRRYLPKIPDAALTLVIMAVIALAFERMGFNLRYLTGFTADSLTFFTLSFNIDLIGKLAAPAFAVAFVGVLEGASIGRSLASRSGERLNVNQMMVGMGMGNLTNSLCIGMDASGSVTRSALNWASGARTAISLVICGAICLMLLMTIGFLIAFIPTTALAAVVVVVAFSLFHRRQIEVSFRSTKADAVVFIMTIASAVLFTLDTAIYIGVFTSVILFLRKAGVPELTEYTINEEGQLAELEDKAQNIPGISILHAEGDLFFGSTELFVEQARQATLDPSLKVVILRLKNARNLDATCAMAIEELWRVLKANDRHLIVSGATKDVFKVFSNSGLLELVGRENFFMNKPGNPVYSTRNALKRAQEILGRQDADIRIFVDKRKREEKKHLR